MNERLSRRPKSRNDVIGEPDIDDMLSNLKKQEGKIKTNNSQKKGGDFERHIANLFSERYNRPFAKQEGSGARTTTKRLDESATDMLTGDILTPATFRFKMECKKGYNDYSLMDLFFTSDERGGKTTKTKVGGWLEKANQEAENVSKFPLFVWRQDRKPIICAIRANMFRGLTEGIKVSTRLLWKGFIFFPLSDFFKIPDERLFNERDSLHNGREKAN